MIHAILIQKSWSFETLLNLWFVYFQDTPEFSDEMFWIFFGAEIAVLTLAIFGCVGGFVQVQKLSHSFHQPYDLDELLSSVTIVGAYIYSIFSMIAAGVTLATLDTKTLLVFIQNALLLVQVSCQGKKKNQPLFYGHFFETYFI